MSSSVIKDRIQDLTQITAKRIRKQLEAEFNVALDKKETDEMVMDILTKIQTVPNLTPAPPVQVPPPPPQAPKSAAAATPRKVESLVSEKPALKQSSPQKKRMYISSEIIEDDDASLANDEAYARELQEQLSERVTRYQTKRRARNRKKPATKAWSVTMLRPSPELQKIIGVDSVMRSEALRRVWDYVKEHNLQDETDKTYILCDENLSNILGGRERVRGLNLGAYVQTHLFLPEQLHGDNKPGTDSTKLSDDEASSEGQEEGQPRPKKQKTDKTALPKKQTAMKKPSGYLQPLKLSDALKAIVKADELPRFTVTKKLWEYIKEHNLQDPADKRYIKCDEALKQVIGKDRVQSFQMSKHISKHMFKREEVVISESPSASVESVDKGYESETESMNIDDNHNSTEGASA